MIRSLLVSFACCFALCFASLGLWAADTLTPYTHIAHHDVLPTIEEFLSTIRDGDIHKAYSDYTSEEFHENMSLDEFEKFVNDHPTLKKNNSFQPHTFYVEGKVATFEGILSSSENINRQAEFDLVKEKGEWKIMGLQILKMEISSPRIPTKK